MRKMQITKQITIMIITLSIVLMGCGKEAVIGEVYGAEHEYITIGEDTYVLCSDSKYHARDKNKKLGKVVFSDVETDPMIVYSIKGDEEGEYIYTLWVYDGAIYRREESNAMEPETNQ